MVRNTGGAPRPHPALSPKHDRAAPVAHQVKVVAILVAKPGWTEALKMLLESLIEPSRAEPGNLRYDLWQDQSDPVRFVLDELYVDAAAVASHRQTPYFNAYVAQIGDLADRTALLLDPVNVT